MPDPIVVGARRILPLVDIVAPGPLAADVFPDLPVSELRALLDAEGDGYSDPGRSRLRMAVQGFLILGAGRTIVVDTCLGGPKPARSQPLPGFSSRWLSSFEQVAVRPEDVDTVITTHLHHDHVGWNTVLTPSGRLQPTFPNARYLLPRADHDHFTGPEAAALLKLRGDYLADSIQPLADAGRLDLVGGDHRIDEGVRLVPAPGHTPGHVAVEITDAADTALLAGDLVHHPLQLHRPEISSALCVDPATSAATRREILDRYADTGAWFLATHLPTAGRLRRDGRGYALTGPEPM